MVLRHSQISLEVTSRADRAFSRAAEIEADDRAATLDVGAERHQVGQRPDVQLVVRRLDAEHPQQQPGGLVGIDAGILEQLVHRHIQDAGGVVGALDIATDPIQRFGVAGEHQRLAFCCCCC